jgi:tetratricopeptide (TPR) repeat protein
MDLSDEILNIAPDANDAVAPGIPAEYIAAVEKSGDQELQRLTGQCREILTANPEHAQALHVIGGIAHRLRLLDLAAEFIRAAIRFGPEHFEFVGNLGNVYQDLGRIDLAIDCFRKVIETAPTAEMAHNNLANLLHEKGELEEAASSYRRAVEIHPEFFGAWSNLGIVLKKLDQVSPAIEAFERAIRIKPDFVEAKTNLCVAQHQQGHTDQAIRGLHQIVTQHPDAIVPANKLMEMQFEQGDTAAAARLARKFRQHNPRHQMAIACETFGRLAAGDIEEFDYLYGHHDHIHRQIIPPPSEFEDRADFHDALQREILNHPSIKWVHDSHETSRRGFVYGLLEQPGPALTAIEHILRDRKDSFISAMPRDADHPFYGMAPENLALKLWATILNGSGSHPSHLHEGSWLSGTYYVRVPNASHPENSEHAGWIAFDGFSHMSKLKQHTKKYVRRVKPEEGLLVLFPSYTFHETVVFHGDDLRISLSFDFSPV